MSAARHRAMFVGVGNPFRSDDAVGIAVLHFIRSGIPSDVKVLEETGDGTELLEVCRTADHVILVDAVQSGAPPGTIHRIDASVEKLPSWFSRSSTHAFGVAEAIELARTMQELPASVVIYGIEGLDFSAGTELSPEVAQVLPKVAAQVLREILATPLSESAHAK
ncbi:MAG TPA: hydrogenase maturation protease [Candidatus Sulfotelmatobacter sp.]|nr:hydrogenase maturation protease [Candidatus Sulfotelmatobacter sp.]